MQLFFPCKLYCTFGAIHICWLKSLLFGPFQETVLAVLDCLKEPIGEVGKVRVYYNLLEADRYGNVPSDRKKFDSESRTGFQIIAQRGDNGNNVFCYCVKHGPGSNCVWYFCTSNRTCSLWDVVAWNDYPQTDRWNTTILQVGANLRINLPEKIILEKLCMEIITKAWVIRFYLFAPSFNLFN